MVRLGTGVPSARELQKNEGPSSTPPLQHEHTRRHATYNDATYSLYSVKVLNLTLRSLVGQRTKACELKWIWRKMSSEKSSALVLANAVSRPSFMIARDGASSRNGSKKSG